MKRRDFLKNTTLATGSTLLSRYAPFKSKNKMMNNIGLQLFSVPKMLEQDLRKGLKSIADMGYKEIELYGPYTFSPESAKQGWNAITPMLGFSGSGFFGQSASDFKSMLKEYGLAATSAHTDLDTLKTAMPQLGEMARSLSLTSMGIAAIPEEKRTSLADYKKIAEEFNEIGAAAKKEGFKFIYHNHGYGLQEENGQIPFQIILDETDPELVFFEMDIFWTTAGKADPIEYLKVNPNRYIAMHLKDMKELSHFAGDGGSPMEWMQLFPQMTSVGEGVLDIEAIVKTAQEAGVKHFYVEQDMVANPEVALQVSIDYLLGL